MAGPFLKVQPPFSYLAPGFNPSLYSLVRCFSRPYLYAVLGIRSIEVSCLETLLEQYRDFSSHRTRLLLAFRHSHVNDGPILFHLLSNIVSRAAVRNGIRFDQPVHAHYVYARNVPVWSGALTAWLFPRMGGVPVLKGAADSRSLSMLRKLLVEGAFPVAIAPEAQVTYNNERPGLLDPGVARLAFWCAEDLEKSGRIEDVRILPIVNHYSFLDPGGRKSAGLLASIERTCGISGAALRDKRVPGETHLSRALSVLDLLLSGMEDFYRQYYGGVFSEPAPSRQVRLERLVEAALQTAERHFHLPHTGSTLQRVLAVRTRGLSRIFREDIAGRSSLSQLKRGLADRTAAEAWYALNHMELADILEYVREDYFLAEPDQGRTLELLIDLGDIVSRLNGGDISGRPDPFKKAVEIRVGKALSVREFTGRSGVSRKEAAASLLGDLERSFAELSGQKRG